MEFIKPIYLALYFFVIIDMRIVILLKYFETQLYI